METWNDDPIIVPSKYDYTPDGLAKVDAAFKYPLGTMSSLMRVESDGKVNARNTESGAIGPFQVLPSTAADPGYGLKAGDPYDPMFSAAYLDKMRQLSGGSLAGGLAKYNAGPVGNPNNPETRKYVPNVLGGTEWTPGSGGPIKTALRDADKFVNRTLLTGEDKTISASIEERKGTSTVAKVAAKVLNTLDEGHTEEAELRAKKEAALKTNDWNDDPIIKKSEGTPVSPLVAAMKPGVLKSAKDVAKATGANLLDVVDMAATLPGLAIGIMGDILVRSKGIVMGEDRRETAKKGAEVTAYFSQPPIRKLMTLAGYGDTFSTSDVRSVMEKVGGWIDNGGEWVEEKTHGLLLKEDVQSLANVAMALGGIKGGASVIKPLVARIGEPKAPLVPKDTPQIRADPTAVPPVLKEPVKPEMLVKKHIEESTGIKDPVEQAKTLRAQRKEVRAAYTEDPEYADYFQKYAEAEVQARAPAAIQADRIEKAAEVGTRGGTVLDTEKMNRPAPRANSWSDVLNILGKPGFKRTPEDLIRLRQFEKQGGKADPVLLAKMAAAGIGIAAGIYLDPQHPIEGAVLGAAAVAVGRVALAAGALAPKAIKSLITNGFKPDTRLSIKDLADSRELYIERGTRSVMQAQDPVLALVPDAARRSALTHWLQGDKTIPITQKELNAAMQAKGFFAQMGALGQTTGTIHSLINDYVTNLWDLNGKNKAAFERILQSPSMAKTSRFDIERKISSLAEGKKMGLVPVTEDLAAIMGIYGNSLMRTVANKQFLEVLQKTGGRDPNTTLLMPTDKAPKYYVTSDHPQLRDMSMHPEIKPGMDFHFYNTNPSRILAGIEAVEMTAKRMEVSFSGFHPKALIEAYTYAGGNILKVPRIITGGNKYLQQIKTGGVGDLVDLAFQGGLKISMPKGPLADMDVAGNFYHSMDVMKDMANSVVPYSGKAVELFTKINKFSDKYIWERIHTGTKLNLFGSTYEKLKRNNLEANAKDPSVPLKGNKELAEIAARFTNFTEGGIDWRRVAEQSKNKWTKDLAMEVMSPEGRRTLRLVAFAPDWAISTVASWTEAIGKGTGFKGLIKPQELADLHRQYVLRTAFYTFTFWNGINYMMSGHWLWDNKDPTTLEMKDGRTVQFAKHAFEFEHLVRDPLKFAVNKLGVLPSEAIAQASGKEYNSPAGKSPPMDTTVPGRLRHVAKRFAPFTVQGSGGVAGAVSSAAGFPVRGKTEEEKATAKEEAKLTRLENKRKAAEE